MSDSLLQPLFRSTARPRASLSPLSAATLLLLVSLVVSTSPAVRGGQDPVELRPIGARSVAISEDRTDDDQRVRQAAPQSQDAEQARTEIAPHAARAACQVADSPTTAAAVVPLLVREALLNLPPPRA